MEHQDSQHRWIRNYNSLAENHLKLLKQQSVCEFFSWKVSGVFFLTVFAAFYLQNQGIFPNAFFFIVPSGVTCLMALALSSKKDLEYGAKIAECVDKGVNIERKADLPCNIFQMFRKNRTFAHRGNLISRIFNFWLIGLATTASGAILLIKIGQG